MFKNISFILYILFLISLNPNEFRGQGLKEIKSGKHWEYKKLQMIQERIGMDNYRDQKVKFR